MGLDWGKIKEGLGIAVIKARMPETQQPYRYPIKPPELLPGVAPKGEGAPVMAMDYGGFPQYTAAQSAYAQLGFAGGGFPGYQYLAQLLTRPEYRAFAEGMASELTREWVKITSKRDDDEAAAEKIKDLENEMERLGVRAAFALAAVHDVAYGRAMIYPDIRGADPKDPLTIDAKTVAKGSLQRFTCIEPIWTTPVAYDALNPAAPSFYKPSLWYVMGKPYHATRLMTIITRPVPDILKPAFNFSGISLNQLAEPYVDNWLRTRQAVSDLIDNFSTTVLKTSMGTLLQTGTAETESITARADLFTLYRSNKGLFLLDKDTEELEQLNVPLSGLSDLQAQAQEHMCSVSRMPAIVLTGISPSGLNASNDNELKVWYDWVRSQQNAHWLPALTCAFQLAQINLWGAIDEDLQIEYVPLYQMTPEQKAKIRLDTANADAVYLDRGVVAPEETRERLARDPDSGYNGLDVDDVSEAPGLGDPEGEAGEEGL